MMNNCVKDDQTDNTNCGEDHHHGEKECRDDSEMSGCNYDKRNEDNSNCGDEGRDRCDVQDCGDENEQNHNENRHNCVDDDYCAEDMNTKEQDNVQSDRMGSVVEEQTCPVIEQIEMGALVNRKLQQSYQETRRMENVKIEKRKVEG